jgi:hypothetical protein
MLDLLSKIFSSKPHVTNLNSEKSFNQKYNELGIFEYHEDGFTIRYERFVKTVRWIDIIQLNVFKVDLWTIDRIDMEIITKETIFSISEDVPGWFQFVRKTKEIFPTIPKDWEVEVDQPPFAMNYRTIYEKNPMEQN